MMQMVPEEEQRRWQAEMETLYKSSKKEDQVLAILMDLKIGGAGDCGQSAKAKAKAICDLFLLGHSQQPISTK